MDLARYLSSGQDARAILLGGEISVGYGASVEADEAINLILEEVVFI